MTVEKMRMTSPDLTRDNVEKLLELFPGVATETMRDDGTVAVSIDFDLLRQELADVVVEGPQERYHLDWPGKRAAAFAANTPITKTLRPDPEESVDFDSTRNLFIEGDNLDALKLLQESYLGKVKLIYIDPPYNTGNDFVYRDDFAQSTAEYLVNSGQVDVEGSRLSVNLDSSGRFHSDWLSMMYPRLKLARNLLSRDGVIAISIDDNEVGNLRVLGDEVFGRSNFVAQVAVQVNPRGRHLAKFVAKTHESMLIWVRNADSEAVRGLEKRDGGMADAYDRSDERGPFRLLGLRNSNQSFNPRTRPNLYYPLYVDPQTSRVSLSAPNAGSIEVWPTSPDGVQTCWTWGREKVARESHLLHAEEGRNGWRISRKDYLVGEDGAVARSLIKALWLDAEFSNDYGREAVKRLFDASVFDFPKSPHLMRRLLDIAAPPGSIVLDFFAGSATMGEAVVRANLEDGGERRYILVQLDEAPAKNSEASRIGFDSLSGLARERLRRLARFEHDTASAPSDLGFRALRVASSNLRRVSLAAEATNQLDLESLESKFKEGRDGDDLLFHVLLEWGLDLSVRVERLKIEGRSVYAIDDGALIACFERDVDITTARAIAEREPLRAVFLDSAFSADSPRINVGQIFAEVSPSTELRVL